ncbi:L-idonate 5-dehydrogenase [Cupriavidus sp. U2]|uniref:L-idonate 5-dehydrogenase n=1 Tax=Cupriavidus sp. U2 TaxID=2920269 RepID=UPI00129EA080|nr:L-idonate 5-dehydrogenase [Cupriavidus sp. U2]KAI3589485.1 L-idonate 5-dehydrogenase [Cupriavidus sp. U2]
MSLTCHIHASEDLRFTEVEPAAPGAHDVLVRLGAAGICGSDLHYYFHGKVGAFVIQEPLTPGHEASGIVEAVGSAVTRVAPGMKVAINPSHACGQCDYCRAGRDNLCRNMRFLGSASVFPHVQGMFRQHFPMHERQLTPVHADISLGELAFAEPLSVALHGVNRAGELLGKTVLVTGGGTIGSLTVMAARLAGAAQIIVCDIAQRPLDVAAAVGADRTILTTQVSASELQDIADVSLEAAGSVAALGTCLTATRRGGRIVQVGTLPAEGLHFPANSIMARELDYVGAFRFGREFDWAVQYLTSRRLDVRPLLSAQLPLAQAVEAFQLAADKSRSTKVQLTG